MKRAILTLFICGTFVITMQGQYVTIEGRQFKDENGADFYPVVCNYNADIIHDTSGNFYIAPSGAYGVIWGYDCQPITTCYYEAFVHDFTEIRNMGFNSIRLMGPSAEKDHAMTDSFRYTSNLWEYPTIANQIIKNLNAPYAQDSSMNLLLEKLDDILAIAGLCSLKVILVPSRGRLAQSSAAVADVADYLSVFAGHFSNNPIVMAYDLYNEPAWTDQLQNFDPAYDHTKSEVCQYVRSWYDSIKYHDPNHLVTMGLCTFNDVIEWDPGILKLDFISEHIYPNLRLAENYNFNTAMIRFQDELIWTANNMPIPWIIGETGFSATDNEFPPFNDSINIAYSHPPYVWGSTADQHIFTDTIIQMIRNCGASGISWWQFQDTFWGLQPNDSNATATAYNESFFGLLNSGTWDPITGYETFHKPAVADFQAFDPSDPPGAFPMRSNLYYNPYDFITTNRRTIKGSVFNFFSGLPIKDAVVLVVSKVRNIPGDSLQGKLIYHYTFTDSNGVYYAYPAPDEEYQTIIDDIKISAPGCERVEMGWQSVYNDPYMVCKNEEIFYLKGIGWQYDAIITNETIVNGQVRKFQGWNSLTASEIEIQAGGGCEISARKEITLLPLFEADIACEVNIFITETFPQCTDFEYYLKEGNQYFTNNGGSANEIEIIFKQNSNKLDFTIYPNPTTGKIHLQVDCRQLGLSTAKIFDIMGNLNLEVEWKGSVIELDLSGLAKGLYLTQIVHNDKVVNKKLILK